ncbi:TPA: hypothetical protein QH074_004334 [Enterobacter hormaechei subsp. steigerwaltii]|nr:hypothetical protein [Enterobacter hormaechei subsp. steigerwaltii]
MKGRFCFAALVAVGVMVLTGCNDDTPPAQLSDLQLCAEKGKAMAGGRVERTAAVLAELKRRAPMAISAEDCKALELAGYNKVKGDDDDVNTALMVGAISSAAAVSSTRK